MAKNDEEHEKNRREFLEIIFDPAEFQKACDQIDYPNRVMEKTEDYVDYWVDQFKGDTATMDRIIETYMAGEVLGGFVLSKSIGAVKGKDSRFFEGLYDRLAAMENPRGFSGGYVPNLARELDGSQDPHAQFKMQTLRNWHAKASAIGRVTDEAYLKRVVEEVPDDCDFAYQSPQAIAVGRITDQSFLERVLETKTDAFMVCAAISELINKKLLRQYANMPDSECDQQRYEFRSPAQTEAFHKSRYRNAARQRLQELK